MSDQQNERIPIQCPHDIANGVYANLGVANYNHEEFVLDFVFLHPNTKTGEVRSRVVLHPDHVRRLVKMLQRIWIIMMMSLVIQMMTMVVQRMIFHQLPLTLIDDWY